MNVGTTAVATLLACTSCAADGYEIPLSSSTSSATSPQPSDSTTTSPPPDSTTTSPPPTAESSSGEPDCVMPTEEAGWWRKEWRRRRQLQIDTSIFAAPIDDLPVLLRVEATSLGASWSERSGADLRFRSESDVEIPLDIDDIDADGTLFVWLAMPRVDPAEGSQTVWMYYDNPRAEANPDTAEAVWTGHISVHHLGTDLEDSAEDHHGASPWPPEVCDGKCGPRIGVARRFDPEELHEVIFDGHQDYDLGVSPYPPEVMQFSVSLWMRAASLAEYPWGALIAKGDATWRVHASSYPEDIRLTERVTFGFDCTLPECTSRQFDEANNANLVSFTAVDDNQWHHVAATMEIVGEPDPLPPEYIPHVIARIYIDGVEAAEPYDMPAFLIPEDDQPVRLAHNISNATRWRGDLDEVRIEARARSAAEIAADYATVVEEHIAVGEEQELCL